jgi:hypothetical protein
MSLARLLLTGALLLSLLGALHLCPASAQNTLTLSGRVLTKGSNRSSQRFNIKLYPPLKSNKAILLTASGNSGDFKFTGLLPSSYLLEVHLGKDMVYQEVVALASNKNLTIDLRGSAAPKKTVPPARRKR